MGLLWKCRGVRWLQGHALLWGMARGMAVPWGVTVGCRGQARLWGCQGCSAVGMCRSRDAGQRGDLRDCCGDTGGVGVMEQGAALGWGDSALRMQGNYGGAGGHKEWCCGEDGGPEGGCRAAGCHEEGWLCKVDSAWEPQSSVPGVPQYL